MGERQGYSGEDNTEYTGKEYSRRDFLKIAGGATAATALGALGIKKGLEMSVEKTKAILEQINSAPTEKMEVVPWGQELSKEDAEKPRTVDELRSQAGWDRQYTDEFIEVLKERYPDSVTGEGTIQPGYYEVPVNRAE